MTHEILDKGIKEFCETLEDEGTLGERAFFQKSILRDDNTGVGARIIMSIEVFEVFEWKDSMDECTRYLLVPLDSWDCSSVDNKRGGKVINNCLLWRIGPNF